MEVEEEDSGSSQDNFCFLDNSTNPETIRQDPAPSTSRITVPMSSRNFRINKPKRSRFQVGDATVLRRMSLHTGGHVTQRRGPLPPGRRGPPPLPAGLSAAGPSAAGAQEGNQSVRPAGASGRPVESALGEYLAWLAVRPPAPPSPPGATAARPREMSKAEKRCAERSASGHSGSRTQKRAEDACAALRIALERIKVMSGSDPGSLQDSLPDQAVAMLKRFHIS